LQVRDGNVDVGATYAVEPHFYYVGIVSQVVALKNKYKINKKIKKSKIRKERRKER
jgi:hypothetical protein